MKVNYHGKVLQEVPMAQWEVDTYFPRSYSRLLRDIDFCKDVYNKPQFRLLLSLYFIRNELIFSTNSELLLKENSKINIQGKEVVIEKTVYSPQTDTIDYFTNYQVHIIKATDDEKNEKLEDIRNKAKYYLEKLELLKLKEGKRGFWSKIFN